MRDPNTYGVARLVERYNPYWELTHYTGNPLSVRLKGGAAAFFDGRVQVGLYAIPGVTTAMVLDLVDGDDDAERDDKDGD